MQVSCVDVVVIAECCDGWQVAIALLQTNYSTTNSTAPQTMVNAIPPPSPNTPAVVVAQQTAHMHSSQQHASTAHHATHVVKTIYVVCSNNTLCDQLANIHQ